MLNIHINTYMCNTYAARVNQNVFVKDVEER